MKSRFMAWSMMLGLLCVVAVLGSPVWQATGFLRRSLATPTSQPLLRVPSSRPTPAPKTLPWWRTAVFYEVFVRSFQDSNGDGVGDIQGLIQRLDYLNDGNPKTTQDLGVTALWLMPLFRSNSYHGYDVVDYRSIDPRYGTMQDFKRLLQEAHRRGIRVIVDLVINHTSRSHPWFEEAARSPRSPYRNWYLWRKNNPGWKQPWGHGPVWHPLGSEFFYGVFWSGMPDLNFRHPPVRQEILNVAAFWIQQGVDGFRLDAARHLVEDGPGQLQNDRPETHAYWKLFRSHVKQRSSTTVMVGEMWAKEAQIAPYCRGDEMDLAFHFPLAEAIKSTVAAMSHERLWQVLSAPTLPKPCWASFLANHDQERMISQLHGKMPMMRHAAALLLTLPGTPFLYYGEEIGMQNGPTRDDRHKRTPMAWDSSPSAGFTSGKPWFALTPYQEANVAAQTKHPASLLSWFRRLIRLRQQHLALSVGSVSRVPLLGKGHEAVVAFVREHQGQQILVLLNLDNQQTATLTLQLPTPNKIWKSLLQEGLSQVTHLGPPARRTSSPYSMFSCHHQVSLSPGAMLVVSLSEPTAQLER